MQYKRPANKNKKEETNKQTNKINIPIAANKKYFNSNTIRRFMQFKQKNINITVKKKKEEMQQQQQSAAAAIGTATSECRNSSTEQQHHQNTAAARCSNSSKVQQQQQLAHVRDQTVNLNHINICSTKTKKIKKQKR